MRFKCEIPYSPPTIPHYKQLFLYLPSPQGSVPKTPRISTQREYRARAQSNDPLRITFWNSTQIRQKTVTQSPRLDKTFFSRKHQQGIYIRKLRLNSREFHFKELNVTSNAVSMNHRQITPMNNVPVRMKKIIPESQPFKEVRTSIQISKWDHSDSSFD